MIRRIAYQTTKHGCGIASVKNALIDAARNEGFRFLPEPESHESSPSLAELIQYAEEHGLSLRGYRIDPPFDKSWNPGKSILLLKEERSLHAVYCPNLGRGLCWVYDPEKGRRLMSRKNLLGSFSGVYLSVESFRGEAQPSVPRLKTNGRFLLFAFIALAVFSFSFGAFALGAGLPSVFPIVSFCLGAAGLSLFLCFVSRFSKGFATRYRGILFANGSKERGRRFRLLYRLRSLLFGETVRWFALALSLLSVWLLFALRDFPLGISILVGACLLSVSWLTDVPASKRESKRLEEEERSFQREGLSSEEQKRLLASMEKRSAALSRYILARGMLILLLSLAISAFSALLLDSFSFDVVIGYAVGIFLFLTQLDRLFASSTVFLETRKAEQTFLMIWTEEQNRTSTLPMK